MNHLLAFTLCLYLLAQARAEEETFFKPGEGRDESYFAPTLRFSNTAGVLGIWPGLRLGWSKGSILSAGLEGYVLANEVHADEPEGERLQMAVGGVVLESTSASDLRVHPTYSVLIGAGGSNTGRVPDLDSMAIYSFIVVEPAVNIEFNITRNFRVTPGVSYRWISGSVRGMHSKWSVSETSFNVAFKLKDH